MKHSCYEQFAIIKTDSASLFEEQLNERTRCLKDMHPEVHFSEHIPFYAHITYHASATTPESISDEYEMAGVSFACAQCPYFQPVLKDDGEIDMRFKYGECPHSELGRVFKTALACDRLYALIKEGRVKLCFTE